MVSKLNNSSSLLSLLSRQSSQSLTETLLNSRRNTTAFRQSGAVINATTQLSAQIGGLRAVAGNINQAIAITQKTENALEQTEPVLKQLRALAEQANNDSLSLANRNRLSTQVNSVLAQYNQIVDNTQVGGKKLLDGNFSQQSFQVSADPSNSLILSIDSAQSSSIGLFQASASELSASLASVSASVSTNNFVSQSLTVVGKKTATTSIIETAASAKRVATKLNEITAVTGVTAAAETTALLENLSLTGTLKFDLQGNEANTAVNISVDIADTDDLTTLALAINDQTTETGISAISDGGRITLTHSEGEDIILSNFDTDALGFGADFGTAASTVALSNAGIDVATVGGVVSFSSITAFSLKTDNSGSLLATTPVIASQTALVDIDLTSSANARNALAVITGAQEQIELIRRGVSAFEQVLVGQFVVNEQSHFSATAALGQLEVRDVFQLTAELTKAQILQETAQALLAQTGDTEVLKSLFSNQ